MSKKVLHITLAETLGKMANIGETRTKDEILEYLKERMEQLPSMDQEWVCSLEKGHRLATIYTLDEQYKEDLDKLLGKHFPKDMIERIALSIDNGVNFSYKNLFSRFVEIVNTTALSDEYENGKRVAYALYPENGGYEFILREEYERRLARKDLNAYKRAVKRLENRFPGHPAIRQMKQAVLALPIKTDDEE